MTGILDIVLGNRAFIQSRQEKLANVFDVANDTKYKNEILAQPVYQLNDAAMTGNSQKLSFALSIYYYTHSVLNRALVLAVGFDKTNCRDRLIEHGASIKGHANGLMLRDILNGNIAGVRVYLRSLEDNDNPPINLELYGADFFKQAILRNQPVIADMLHGAGVSVGEACNDRRFYNQVFYTGNVNKETRSMLTRLLGEMPLERDFDIK